MRQVTDFFKDLFITSDFPARWESGNWSAFHGGMYIMSNLLIGFAFIALPIIVLKHIVNNKCNGIVKNLYLVFATFLILAGFTVLLDALTFWVPAYRISALLRFTTAIFSWAAIFSLLKVLPRAFALKSQKDLESEIKLRNTAETELQQKNERLLEAEKIAKLCYGHWDIVNDRFVMSDEGYRMYGLTTKVPFTFNSFNALTHPDDREYVKDKLQAIIKTKEFSEFYYRIIADNTEKYIRMNGQLKFDEFGSVKMIIGTLQDVTEQTIYLDHIKDQNETLKEIAWIQSHMVRGPLATIMGLASIIDNNHVTDPDTAKALEGIKAASNSLDDIVKDIVSKSNSREVTSNQKQVFTKVA
jgi:PAS domain-containing protein